MKNNIKFLTVLLAMSFMTASISAQDIAGSELELSKIQKNFESMTSSELSSYEKLLLDEVQDLEVERATSQSPARLKVISSRLNEIFIELSMIQKVLAVFCSVFCLWSIQLFSSLFESGAGKTHWHKTMAFPVFPSFRFQFFQCLQVCVPVFILKSKFGGGMACAPHGAALKFGSAGLMSLICWLIVHFGLQINRSLLVVHLGNVHL